MNEQQLEHIKKKTGIVFQNYQLLPELTVRENILLPTVLLEEKCDEE